MADEASPTIPVDAVEAARIYIRRAARASYLFRPVVPIDRVAKIASHLLAAAERERKHLELISDLSDALTDEGGNWSLQGLLNIRALVANTLPLEFCPDWLIQYRDSKSPDQPASGTGGKEE